MNKDIKQIYLELLDKLDSICTNHGLKYYIAYGTCLGAVRHQGFIPWDHDADALMPIEDAKELIKYQNELGEDILLKCKETDSEFGSIHYQLIYNKVYFYKDNDTQTKHSFSLDIYPYYNCPQTKIGLLINIWISYLYRVLVNGKKLKSKHSICLRFFNMILLSLFKGKKRESAIRKLEKHLMSVKNGREILDYYGLDVSFYSAITYPKEWFAEPKLLKFENKSYKAPTEPEKYLTKRYGDFMKLPSKEEQKIPSIEIIVDNQGE